MGNRTKRWEVISKEVANKHSLPLRGSEEGIVNILLENRNLTSKKGKEEFIKPPHPKDIPLSQIGIKEVDAKKCIERIKESLKNKEKVIVYGDYDADGICATAILWEALYGTGISALPYIPERFSEGYGINAESVGKLKGDSPDLGLVITVDNGIVAVEEMKKINKLGIDVIVCDHHQKGKTLPKARAFFYSDKVCGSALAWMLAREISGKSSGLELAAIGTVADQMPLLGINRSFAKYGIGDLRETKRPGLLALFKEAGINQKEIGTYEINYLIAPRINAMGRLSHAIDSLRLVCTKDPSRAEGLAYALGRTNLERQKIVEGVIFHARTLVKPDKKTIILAHESYHEGVIGLAAGKLVEEFYRPAIVISKGQEVSKASARSISGFNIIEAIRGLEKYLLEGGGHPMAAGFSIRTKDLGDFVAAFEKAVEETLTDEMLSPKLKIDSKVDFKLINGSLIRALKAFNPTGLGNPTPTFETDRVEVIETRPVGREMKHLKLTLKEGSSYLEAIGFGFGHLNKDISRGSRIDVVYTIDENTWNGATSIQLKIKDLKTA